VPKGTKADADLDLLIALERGEVVTQQMIKRDIGVSVGLVNALIKRAVKKGLVKAKQAPYKRYAYYLTPQGFAEKSRLVAQYLETSLDLFRQARDQYAAILRQLGRDGKKRIVLAGGGELAEIAVLAAVGEGVRLLAIIDRGANEVSRYGVAVVQSLDAVAPVDAVVVTDASSPQETYEALRGTLDVNQIFAPDFLRITVNRGDLLITLRR
jgi:DNA-binding MarR family transcriptional regulator